MTLETTILNNLSNWRPSGRQTLKVADPASSCAVRITGDKCDGLGSRLWDISLRRDGAVEAESLADWGERICARARGLSETLKIYEVDKARGEAILRSQVPTERDGRLSYFEILLQSSGEATFRRYQAERQSGGKRRQISFILTHEITAKAAAALAGLDAQ